MILIKNPLIPKDIKQTFGSIEVKRTITVTEVVPAENGLDHFLAAKAFVASEIGLDFNQPYEGDPVNGLVCTDIDYRERPDSTDCLDIIYTYKQTGVASSEDNPQEFLSIEIGTSGHQMESMFDGEGKYVTTTHQGTDQPVVIQKYMPVTEVVGIRREANNPYVKSVDYGSTINRDYFELYYNGEIVMAGEPYFLLCESISGSFDEKDGTWLVRYHFKRRKNKCNTQPRSAETPIYKDYGWKDPAWFKLNGKKPDTASISSGGISMVPTFDVIGWEGIFD